MKYPLVSVIMPTLNSAQYIRETIHSLIDQKNTRLEVIVIDGGSTDETIPLVKSYMGDDDLKLIQLAPGLGIAKALNAGLDAAKGEFIARMDADDIAYQWRFHDQVRYMIQNPDVSLIGTGVDLFGMRDGVSRSAASHEDILNEYLINNPFFHPTIMCRRKLYDEGLFYYNPDSLCDEDYELWGRLIPVVKCANLDMSSIRFRMSMSSGQWDPRQHHFKKKALANFCKSFGIDNDQLVETLADFQSCHFPTYTSYKVLREYAHQAEAKKLPKLGWIHQALLQEPDYQHFMMWHHKTRNWIL